MLLFMFFKYLDCSSLFCLQYVCLMVFSIIIVFVVTCVFGCVFEWLSVVFDFFFQSM